MKFSTIGAVLLLPLLGVLTPVQAAPAPAAAPATLKPITFDGGKGVFDFTERLRFEYRRDNFDFNSGAHSPTDDNWLVQRFRAGLAWKPSAELAFQVQVQDAREWGSERPKVPFILGAEGNDTLDLRLASLTYGDPKKSPVVFTLGRQTILLGEERLVGASEWNNFGRVFDAAKALWNITPGKTTATFFVSSVVNVEGTNLGDGWKFDHSSSNDLFSGVAVSHKVDLTSVLDGYLLWRDKQNNNPIYSAATISIPAPARTAAAYDIGQDVFTLGLRYLVPPKAGEFDAEYEVAGQWGQVDRQTATATGPYGGSSPTLDQRAWAFHSLVGYTPAGLPGKLRVDVEYNVASGDTNRTDGQNGSFMNLFPQSQILRLHGCLCLEKPARIRRHGPVHPAAPDGGADRLSPVLALQHPGCVVPRQRRGHRAPAQRGGAGRSEPRGRRAGFHRDLDAAPLGGHRPWLFPLFGRRLPAGHRREEQRLLPLPANHAPTLGGSRSG